MQVWSGYWDSTIRIRIQKTAKWQVLEKNEVRNQQKPSVILSFMIAFVIVLLQKAQADFLKENLFTKFLSSHIWFFCIVLTAYHFGRVKEGKREISCVTEFSISVSRQDERSVQQSQGNWGEISAIPLQADFQSSSLRLSHIIGKGRQISCFHFSTIHTQTIAYRRTDPHLLLHFLYENNTN